MVESGEEVEFTLTIGCSSLLNDCTGAILTDILPAEAIPVAASLLPVLITSGIDGMSYPITPSYNPMTNTVTWDFTALPENGLPDGTSLQIKYTILVNGGTVPNGEIIKNIANLISDNAGTGKDSTETTVQASPQWSINKTLRTGLIFHDFNETYRITINNTGGTIGNLNLSNVIIRDTLPAGAIFVSATNGGVYDMMTNVVTWNLGAIPVTTNSTFVEMTVVYPASDMVNNNTGFNPGMDIPKTNRAGFTADIPGGSITRFTQRTDDLNPPSFDLGITKSAQDIGFLVLGERNYFRINVENASTVPVGRFTLTDTIPNQFSLDSIRLTDFSPDTVLLDTIRVQLNGTGSLIDWVINQSLTGSPILDVTTIPGFTAGDYVSIIQFAFGTVPFGFEGNVDLVVKPAYFGAPAADNAGNPVSLDVEYTNRATLTATRPLDNSVIPAETASDEMCIKDRLARLDPQKAVEVNYITPPPGAMTTGNPYFPGARVRYLLTLENDGNDGNSAGFITGSTAFADLVNPIMADLLPPDLYYEAGSWEIDPTFNNTTGLTASDITFDSIGDFNGSGRTLLRWRFTGNVTPGSSLRIRFNASISMMAPIGVTQRNDYCLTSASQEFHCDETDCGETSTSIANFFSDIPSVDEACCKNVQITISDTTATLQPVKVVDNPTGPFAPTGTDEAASGFYKDTVQYTVTIENDQMANFTLPHPIAMDLLPAELEYVAGSLELVENTTGLVLDDAGVNPTFEVIPNFSGTGRTLLRWVFNGAFPIDSRARYRFKTFIRSGASGTIENALSLTSNDRFYNCQAPASPFIDTLDLDGDGISPEILCSGSGQPISITSLASMSATKYVKGANDTTFLRLPDIGSTNPGDTVQWRTVLFNPGNVTLTDVVMIDIFPYIGDVGVKLIAVRLSSN